MILQTGCVFTDLSKFKDFHIEYIRDNDFALIGRYPDGTEAFVCFHWEVEPEDSDKAMDLILKTLWCEFMDQTPILNTETMYNNFLERKDWEL